MSEFIFEDAVAGGGSPVFESINGTCQVLETGGVRPTTLIKTTNSWFVRVRLRTEGLPANDTMSGAWQLRVHLEGIGAIAGEFDLPAVDLAVPLAPAPAAAIDYGPLDIMTAPGVVPAGSYKLVTTATFIGAGGAPAPIAGFCEGPVLQFYVP